MKSQLSIFPRPSLEHGGEIRRGRRKLTRPFDPGRPLRIVMRADRARGSWSMLHPKNRKRVQSLVASVSRKSHIKIYRFANVGNHLHFLARARTRDDLQYFLRVLPSLVMFAVTGARKGRPRGKFWTLLTYSRVVSWGRDVRNVLEYLLKNLRQARKTSSRVRILPSDEAIGGERRRRPVAVPDRSFALRNPSNFRTIVRFTKRSDSPTL